jgi:hypothetical protein
VQGKETQQATNGNMQNGICAAHHDGLCASEVKVMIEVQTPYGRLKPQDIANLMQDLANECEAADMENERLKADLRAYKEKYEPENDA